VHCHSNLEFFHPFKELELRFMRFADALLAAAADGHRRSALAVISVAALLPASGDPCEARC
jgi:hypothetical protein